MVLFRALYPFVAAISTAAALSLDGTKLRELVIDHGNGTIHFWTEKEHANVDLLTTDIVDMDIVASNQQAALQKAAGPGATLLRTFCDGFRAVYPQNLYDNANQKFCSDVSIAATYYFASMFDILENAVCQTEAGANFACGFILDIVEQSAFGTIGPEAQEFCLAAFSAIHKDCNDKFGLADVSITETNGNNRGVEYRNIAIDENAANCANVENPTPGRPFQCKVRSL